MALDQKKKIHFFLSGLIIIILTFILFKWWESTHTKSLFKVLNAPLPQASFPLVRGAHSQPSVFKFQDLLSHWTLVLIGYTSCPDICPYTLAHLREIYPQLQKQLPDFQVLFISIDPHRDHPQQLHDYLQFFHPEFISVTASHEALYPLTQVLDLHYALTDSERKQSYFVDHSTSMTLVDPNGVARIQFTPQDPTQDTRIPLQQMIKGINTLKITPAQKT